MTLSLTSIQPNSNFKPTLKTVNTAHLIYSTLTFLKLKIPHICMIRIVSGHALFKNFNSTHNQLNSTAKQY